MSSNPSSRLLVLSALVFVAAAVGGVAAIDSDVPATSEVGNETSATITLNQSDLYQQYDEWTLRGETDLENATWTIVGYNAADRQVNRTTYPQNGGDGATFEHPVNIENDVVRLEVRVQGTVPDDVNWSYSPPQSITVADLVQVKGNDRPPIETFTTRPYTQESEEAREAIQDAQDAVNASGGSDARDTLGDAKDFYNVGEFQNAIDAANRAENAANQAQQQGELLQTAMYVIVALVVLAIIGGAIWWYRKNQTSSRL